MRKRELIRLEHDYERWADSLLVELEARGFDGCWLHEPDPNGDLADQNPCAHVACSQCEALVINGVACHETGCPRATKECRGCNALLPARAYNYCPDCQ